jgi:hypothetical protein
LNVLLPGYRIKTDRLEFDKDQWLELAKRRDNFDIFSPFTKDLLDTLEAQLETVGFRKVAGTTIFKYN